MDRKQLDEYLESQRENIIRDISSLVCINSERTQGDLTRPFGEGAAKALETALSMASASGFCVKNYDNYVGTIDFNDKETQLDILAHLDVVPSGDGWTVTEPFVPVVLDGKLYGRGTADDKGPAIAALYAMKAIKELNIPLNKNVRLILGTDEECGSSDIEYYYQKEKEAPMTFSPDGEFPVINIEKGGLRGQFFALWDEEEKLPRVLAVKGGTKANIVPGKSFACVEGVSMEQLAQAAKDVQTVTLVKFVVETDGSVARITATGQGAHASNPKEGNNALTGLINLLCRLPLASGKSKDNLFALKELFPHGDYGGKALGVEMEDEISGNLTLNFSILDFTASGFHGGFDSRTPLCATKENMLMVVKEKLREYGMELSNQEMNPPHYVDPESAFIKTLLNCYETYTGLKGECLAIGGGTYVHHLQRGVAFGCSMPGIDNRIHGADEFAIIDDLITSAKIFAKAIIELCN